MILTRAVFGMEEVADLSLEDVIEKQAKNMGAVLGAINDGLKEKSPKPGNWEELQAEGLKDYMELIKFSSDCIVFEKDYLISKFVPCRLIEKISQAYMLYELGKETPSRNKEYFNYVVKVLSFLGTCISLKYIKLGNRIYQFISFNKV